MPPRLQKSRDLDGTRLGILAVILTVCLAASLLVLGPVSALADPPPPIPTPTPTDPPTSPPPEDPPPQQPPPQEQPQEQPPPPPPPQYPPLPADSGSGKRIVYSQREMRLWMVEGDETVVGSWRVTGRRGKPKAGVYRVFSKSRHARIRNLRWEYMTRFARGRSLSMGFHSIPRIRGRPIMREDQLGTGVSGGCVRMADANAERLWHFAPVGTTVVVKGP